MTTCILTSSLIKTSLKTNSTLTPINQMHQIKSILASSLSQPSPFREALFSFDRAFRSRYESMLTRRIGRAGYFLRECQARGRDRESGVSSVGFKDERRTTPTGVGWKSSKDTTSAPSTEGRVSRG